MPIFKVQKNKAKQIPTEEFKNEKELQAFFEENLEELLGVTFVATEYPTGEGFIDTLGIDESGSPVVIEYKYESKDDVLAQGLFYYNWLVQNKQHFNLLVAKTLADRKVNWDHPRVILIAKSFNKYTQAAVQQMQNIELKKYLLYDDNLFHLESVYSPSSIKIKKPSAEVPKEPYGVEYHLGKTKPELAELFKELRENILQWDGVSEQPNQKSGITYRTTKSFTRFEFNKQSISLLLRQPKYKDPKKLVRDITTFEWGYKGLVKIKPDSDIGYLINLIKQSYEETL